MTTSVFSNANPVVPVTLALPALPDTHNTFAGHARRRYQFVLARVLFCAVLFTGADGVEERVTFFKDGEVRMEGVCNPVLQALAAAITVSDFNVAFWEIRRIGLDLAQSDATYSFIYDSGLQELLALAKLG